LTVLKGVTVAGGFALGRVHVQGYEDGEGFPARIASDQVENELNGLREALASSRAQIEEIRLRQEGKLSANELRIFDTHIAYLQDPMFVDAIERLVVNERLPVRAGIKRVVADYDRIFSLVENDALRQRASDFRDVATRVLRNLEGGVEHQRERAPRPSGRYILVARQLTTADMFNLENEEVEGIVAEEGGFSSHAAILARSMGIPAVTGIRDLPGKLRHGDYIIVDAAAGEVHVNPDSRLIQEYEQSAQQFKASRLVPPKREREHATRDGTRVRIFGSCGSVGEVGLARTWGMDGIGLFRTELLFLVDKKVPAEDLLVRQYEEVARQPKGQPVHFRLLDVSAGKNVPGLPTSSERNPAMGLRGVRLLLAGGEILRLQIRAILRAAAGHKGVAVLVPFVSSVAELQRVKAAILEERHALRKQGVACADTLAVAPIIEVPAAAFVLRAFLNESDFAVVAIDDLQAHLYAADRDTSAVRDYYEVLHPALFELLARMASEAAASKKRLVLFGEGAADPMRIPFYLGVGIREFSVAPVRLEGMLEIMRRFTIEECRQIAGRVLEAPRALEVQRILVQMTD
jgi:phosphotransferase system enzyme I (PtsI)